MAEDAFAGFLNEQVEGLTSILQLRSGNQTLTTQALAPAAFLEVLAFVPFTGHEVRKVWGGKSGYQRGPPGVWLTAELPLQFPRVTRLTGTGPWQRLSVVVWKPTLAAQHLSHKGPSGSLRLAQFGPLGFQSCLCTTYS